MKLCKWRWRLTSTCSYFKKDLFQKISSGAVVQLVERRIPTYFWLISVGRRFDSCQLQGFPLYSILGFIHDGPFLSLPSCPFPSPL